MAWDKRGWEGGRVWIAPDGTRTFHIYKMRNGRRYSVSTRCTTHRAALKELDRWEIDPDNYKPQGTDEVLIEPLIEAFVEEGRQRKNSEGRIALRRHMMEWWAERIPGDVRAFRVDQLPKLLKGASNPERRKSVLKTFLKWLHRSSLTERDLGSAIHVVPSQPAQFTRPKLISLERHQKVVAKLDQKYGDLLVILAGTGWHIEELGRFVEEGDIEYPDFERYVLRTPRHKNGDVHRTQVSAKVEEAALRAKERGWFNRQMLNRMINRACKDLKIAPYSPSWYRHSVATWAIEKGADPAAVSTFLGHRHPATVKRFYAVHAVVPKVPTLE